MIAETEESEFFPETIGLKRRRCSHSYCTEPSEYEIKRSLANSFSVAWCSFSTNKIYFYNSETKETSEGVDGVRLPGIGVNLLYHIPKTNYLICSTTANRDSKFEVIEAGKKMRRAFTFEKTPGNIFDVRYNSKANTVALLSMKNEIAYHLFDMTDMDLIKRAKWQPAHKGAIASQDFDAEGIRIATMDETGTCLISEINSDNRLFCIQVGQFGNYYNKCRWNPRNPFVALTFDETRFNVVDTEKQTVLHLNHLKLHNDYRIYGIDWHTNGNLLASCSADRSVNIYDTRQAKNAVKTFISQQSSIVVSVRWSSCGNMIAMGTCDVPASVLDFSTGRTLYSSKNRDGSKIICPNFSHFHNTYSFG